MHFSVSLSSVFFVFWVYNLITPKTFLTFENYWYNLKPDLGRFYDRGVPKRKVLGWYSLVFEGILTLTIDLKKNGLYQLYFAQLKFKNFQLKLFGWQHIYHLMLVPLIVKFKYDSANVKIKNRRIICHYLFPVWVIYYFSSGF
jgi:hypothetical protein